MSSPKEYVREIVLSDSGIFGESLPDFLARINALVAGIPEECRATAEVHIRGSGMHDGAGVDWDITYWRAMTDDEMARKSAGRPT